MAAENTAKTAEAEITEPQPCQCSLYDAVIPDELTEANLASGDYQILTTGCTATTKRQFAPGHDAKLKSALIRWGSLGYDIRREEGGVASSASAEKHASRYAFAPMVAAGVKRAEDKAAEKAAKAEARKAAKAPEEPETTAPETAAQPAPKAAATPRTRKPAVK